MKVRKRKQMKTDNSAKKVNSVKKERREKKEKHIAIFFLKKKSFLAYIRKKTLILLKKYMIS